MIAPTGSARSLLEVCAVEYCCLFMYMQNKYWGSHGKNCSAVLYICSVLSIDIKYQVLGVRFCSYSQYLHYCLFSGLSAVLRVQSACCSWSNLGVYCDLFSAAMPHVLLLLLLCCCWCCGWVFPAAAAMPSHTRSAAVAGIFDVVLLLSLLSAGEAVYSAKRDVGIRYSSPQIRVISVEVMGTWQLGR